MTVRKTPRRGGGGRPRDPLSRPGQARAAGATGSRVAQQSGNACGSAIDRAILGALFRLLGEILAGQRPLRMFRQMKMYNDPTMNPYLYKTKAGSAAA